MINPEDIKAGMTLGHADSALIRDALSKLAEEKRINSKLREDRAGLARECNALRAKLAVLFSGNRNG